jgi:hypothetical protein
MMSESAAERNKKIEDDESDCHPIADRSEYSREVCPFAGFPQTVAKSSFENPDVLLSGIEISLSTTEKSTLIAGRRDWLRKLRLCINGDGK